MFPKLNSPMKSAAILGMVLAFALSTAWATVNYHSVSTTIKKGKRGGARLVMQGSNVIDIYVYSGALDAYMTEQGITEVEITADLAEELVQRADGSSFYRLEFEFGPSGAYFEPEPFFLKLKGDYAADDNEVWLYDENGEAVEGRRTRNRNTVTFEILHFSSYTYDQYDEY